MEYVFLFVSFWITFFIGFFIGLYKSDPQSITKIVDSVKDIKKEKPDVGFIKRRTSDERNKPQSVRDEEEEVGRLFDTITKSKL